MHGKLKAKISDNLNSIVVTLECYFHLFQKKLRFSNKPQTIQSQLIVRVEVPFNLWRKIYHKVTKESSG